MNKRLAFCVFFLASCFLLSPLASAMPSWATLSTAAYGGDTSGGAGYSTYAAYFLAVADAADRFGGSDVSSIQQHMDSQFSTAVPSGGTAFADPYYYEGQYTLDNYVGSGFDSSDYVAIAFYGETAYRVFGAGSASLVNGSLIFDDMNTNAAEGSIGGWKTVPEPTGALLLLIGMAGLCLRRERRV